MGWPKPKFQRGVALPVVLVFVLIMTMLSLFSMRSSVFKESISKNQLDTALAYQAAEAALRDAELDMLIASKTKGAALLSATPRCSRAAEFVSGLNDSLAAFQPTCLHGLCRQYGNVVSNFATGVNPEFWWPAANGGIWNDVDTTKPFFNGGTCASFTGGVPFGTYTGAALFPGVARQPEYLIELFQEGEIFFRITARGFGADDRTEIVLQSHYVPDPEL
jgi:type IV pilus assembly protein PilX